MLSEAGALPNLAQESYLLGATAVPPLRAGHHPGSLGTAKPDEWLAENLNVLATLISKEEEKARTLKISDSSIPKL